MIKKPAGKVSVSALLVVIVLGLLLVWKLNSQNNANPQQAIELIDVIHDTCFSPNGDGVKDTMAFKALFQGPARKPVFATLFVKKNEQLINFRIGMAMFSQAGTAEIKMNWNGKDWRGQNVAAGKYSLLLYYFDIPGLFNQLANQKIEKVMEKIEKRLLQRTKQEVLKRWEGEVSIDSGKPVLAVTNPATDVSTYNATWPSKGDVDGADTLTVNNSPVIIDNGHFATVLNLQPGINTFTYLAEDCAGNRDQQVRTIERLIDTTPPAITITSPKEGEKYTALPLTIAATWEDSGSGIALPTLKILLNGTDIASSLTVTENGTSGAIDDESLLSEGANTLRLEVSDQAGNSGTESVHFTFEKIAAKDKTFIYGRVFNMADDNPLSGALITASGNTTQSDDQGNWKLMFGAGGTYKITIGKPGFTEVNRKVAVAKGKEAVSEDAYLTPLDTKVTPIGPEGGTHSNSDGTVELVIPAGALSETKNIQSTRLAGSKALPGDLNATDNLEYPISFLFCADLMPDGTVFAQPVKLRVKNTWGFAAGTQIPFAYWDTNALKWVPEGMAKVNADKTWLEAEVSHFSPCDINIPADAPRYAGPPIFEVKTPPVCRECNIGSSVDVNSGSLQTEITVPGVKLRGGDTGVTLVYNSATAYPTTVVSILDYNNNALALKPQRTKVQVSSPLLGGGAGSPVVKALNFNAPDNYGSGAFIFSGNYLSGRTVQTGYQKINFNFTNYYPGIYALTSRWGGAPIGSTGVISSEPAYLENKNEENIFMVSRADSPFGKGWHLANLKKLHFEDSKAVVVDGNGGYREYVYDVNYADKISGASVKTTSNIMHEAEKMLSDKVLNPVKQDGCGRFYICHSPCQLQAGINQSFIIDLGQEREIYKIGIDFPQYWDRLNIWDFIKISTSVDNIEYLKWGQYGEPTLKDPAQGLDPLDNMIKSPYFVTRAGQPVRYIKYELGYPSVNTVTVGSGIYRVYAIGSENELQALDGQKWPKLYLDQPSGNYIQEEFSGHKTIFDASGVMIAEKERSGRTINYEYNGDNLIRISYPENVYMEFSYGSGGRLEKIKDASGRETVINMDEAGNLQEVVYPDNEARQFTYDGRGLLTSDKKGNAEKKYTWDNRYPVLTEVELPNHGKRILEPWALKNVLNDRESSPEQLIDFTSSSMESTATFEDGRREKYVTGSGLSWKYENDRLREKITYADLERNLLPVKIEKGAGGWETSQISYNDDWQVRNITSYLRDNIWYTEDFNDSAPYYPGNSDFNINTHNTTIVYNAQRLVAKVIKSNRDNQTFTYDANGRVVQVDNYSTLGKTTKYAYNEDGDLLKITYPDGKINEMTYNDRGLVIEVKNNDGTKTTMERDSRGDVIAMVDEANRRVELTRDIMGRVLKEKSPSGKEVSYQWGGAGCSSCGDGSKLTQITDSASHTWKFNYDVMGNPLEMIYPDSSKISQEYDIAGRLAKFFNKRGQEISYTYDNFGKLLKKTTPAGDIDFTYDIRERISEITGNDFHYRYSYGNTNNYMRLVKEEDVNSGNWNQRVINFYGLPEQTFDNFDWNKKYYYNFGITPVGPTPITVTYFKRYLYNSIGDCFPIAYTYDNGLRPVKKINATFSNENYKYFDTNGLLNRIYYRPTGNNPTLYSTGSLDFSRDTSGLITGLTGDKQLNATYDSDLQINTIQHTLPQPFDESYTYDDNGNRLTSLNNSFTYDDLNRLTESATHNYEYDADGNMTMEKNKLTGETKKYYYDSENRMVKYEHQASDISPIDITAEYKYDIYGRRIQKSVNGTITNFTWEGDSLAMELNSANQPVRKYFIGTNMDDYEGHLEYSEVTDWTKIFDIWNNQGGYSYIKDQVGTIYKVYDHRNHTIADSRAYDSFGNLVNQTGSTKTPLGFQGKYYDSESGLNYFYHRYYNPAIGRFTSEDPIGMKADNNFFRFVNNNPVNGTDPLGLMNWDINRFPDPDGNKANGSGGSLFNLIDWSTIGMAFQGSIFGLSGRIEIVHYDTKCQHCIKVLVGGGGAGQVISGFAGMTIGGGMGGMESDSSGSVGFSYGEGFRASGHSISFPEGGTAGYSFDFGFGGSLFPYEFSGNIMTEIFTKCWKK